MTATPIPRTLALTVYGDLDISVIDQMPSGRKPVITEIIAPDGRDNAYESIRKELQQGRQTYIICPRISDPDEDTEQKLNLRSVTSEAKRLSETVFQEYTVGIMHSKMTPRKKEEIMAEFSNHEIDILVSTSVVEVGVNVPNATNIIIEGAERFGLAQLHQLRGRVIRGNHQAYCYLFADGKNDKTVTRLQSFVNAKNGFELAELDLAQRGAGDMIGSKQWGVSDLAMHALRNIKLVEYARTEAQTMIEHDKHLNSAPLLQKIILEKKQAPHME
jgi:ATP-dependent DNA helicase RecG